MEASTVLLVVSVLAAFTSGFLTCALFVSAKIADVRSLSVMPDPLIQVYKEDGTEVMSMSLWEWIGRAVVSHALPPGDLDRMRVYLDGVEVRRTEDGVEIHRGA